MGLACLRGLPPFPYIRGKLPFSDDFVSRPFFRKLEEKETITVIFGSPVIGSDFGEEKMEIDDGAFIRVSRKKELNRERQFMYTYCSPI